MANLLCKARAACVLCVLWFVSMGTAYGQEAGSVALYRLTRCCPGSAWTDAEYAAIKELDAMDVSVTLLDRRADAEEGLEHEIETIGKSGNYDVLLYFFKNISRSLVGVRVAVFKKTGQNVEIRHLVYTTQPSVNALSVVTLKAVEAAREAVFGPEPISPSLLDAMSTDNKSSNDSRSSGNERPSENLKTPPASEKKPGEGANRPSQANSPKSAAKETEKKDDEVGEKDEDRFSDLEKAPRRRERKERKRRERKQRGKERVAIVPHRLALGIVPGFMWSPNRVWAFDLAAAANYRIVDSLFIELNIGGTVTATGFSIFDSRDPRGQDKIIGTYRSVLFRAALFWGFLSKGRVHPMLGIVGGAALTFAKRTYEFDDKVEKGFSNVAFVGGQARLAIDLSNHFGLVFGAEASVYLPEVEFAFDRNYTVTIGRPLVRGFCNVEYRF